MNAFTMWEEKIVFLDGWFVYMDGKGNNSIISHARARAIEYGYRRYQASMDVDKGGLPPEMAYGMRGFTLQGDKYVLESYRVDELIVGNVNPVPSILSIPETLQGIKINCVAKEAFKNETTIEKLVLHDGVQSILESAFEGCKNLSELEIPHENIEIKTDAFKDTKLCFSEVTYLNKVLLKVDPGYRGVLQVKEGTLSIAEDALSGCVGITQVALPDGLISIGDSAFSGCSNLVSIELPESVRSIGMRAFSKCIRLQKIKLPSTMELIGAAAFEVCEALTSVVLPEGLSIIQRGLFYNCINLKQVNIPDTVKNVGLDSFEGTGIFTSYMNSPFTELYVGNWLIHYKDDKLFQLKVREGTVGIADMDWYNSRKIQSVILPESLRYIGANAFLRAPIDSVDLPRGLRYVGDAAFRGTWLRQVILPATVREVGTWAFIDCENIEKITVEGKETNIVWPAITGRKDKYPIMMIAHSNSKAYGYYLEYHDKYNLFFMPFVTNL